MKWRFLKVKFVMDLSIYRLDIGCIMIVTVIALTANVIIGAKEQYLNKGFDGFLSKLIAMNELMDLILQFVIEEKKS